MIKLLITIIIIIFITLSVLPVAMAEQTNINNHYIIVGHIYPPYNSTDVHLKNIRTSEIMSVNIIDCKHNLKEYLFELANLKQGWIKTDKLLLTYDNKSIELNINTKFAGIQKDFNTPDDYNPIPVVVGTILILSASGLYYYIKRKKQ